MSRLRASGLFITLPLLFVLILLLEPSPQPQSVRQEVQAAQGYLALDLPLQAAEHMAQAARHAPEPGTAWELAGKYALQGGEPQTAIQYLENARPSGLSVQGWQDLGEAYRQVDQLPQAAAAWQAALQMPGKTPGAEAEIYRRLAAAQQDLGDYAGAAASLQALIGLEPENARLHYRLGLLLAATQPEAALPHLEQAGRLDDDLTAPAEQLRSAILNAQPVEDPAYTLLLTGQNLAAQQEWELAAAALQRAVELRPDYAEAWAYLALALQHLYPTPAAAPDRQAGSQSGYAEMQKAMALDPDSLAVRLALALYWSGRGQYDLALEQMRAAIDLQPENPLLYLELGNFLAQSGDLFNAYGAYTQAITLQPQNVAYLRSLVYFSLQNDYQVAEIALPVARRAVILAPRDAPTLDTMAQVLIQQGDLYNAERFLQRALANDPHYAVAYFRLAQIYLLRNDLPAARQAAYQAYDQADDEALAAQVESWLQIYFP